jgi:hypothetical protein
MNSLLFGLALLFSISAFSSNEEQLLQQQLLQQQQPEQTQRIGLAQQYKMAEMKKNHSEELIDLRKRIDKSNEILRVEGLGQRFKIDERGNTLNFKQGIYASDGAGSVCLIHPYAQVRCEPAKPCKIAELQLSCLDRNGAEIKTKFVFEN